MHVRTHRDGRIHCEQRVRRQHILLGDAAGARRRSGRRRRRLALRLPRRVFGLARRLARRRKLLLALLRGTMRSRRAGLAASGITRERRAWRHVERARTKVTPHQTTGGGGECLGAFLVALGEALDREGRRGGVVERGGVPVVVGAAEDLRQHLLAVEHARDLLQRPVATSLRCAACTVLRRCTERPALAAAATAGGRRGRAGRARPVVRPGRRTTRRGSRRSAPRPAVAAQVCARQQRPHVCAWREGACCSMLVSPTTSVSGCTRRLERSAMRWGAHGVVSAMAL